MIYIPLSLWSAGDKTENLSPGRYRLTYGLPMPDGITEQTYSVNAQHGQFFVERIDVRPQADEIIVTAIVGGAANTGQAQTAGRNAMASAVLAMVASLAQLKRVQRIIEVKWWMLAAIPAGIYLWKAR